MANKYIRVLKYDKNKYPLLFFVIFSCTIFENFKMAESYALTDLLYFLFAGIFVLKNLSVKACMRSPNMLLFPALFLAIALIDFLMFNNVKMFSSQIRFVFNCSVFAIIATYILKKDVSIQEKLVSTYVYVCVLCSSFIIIQFISFYLLRLNLAFDFGSYQISINHASLETPSLTAMYRTGGFFKEPSWFVVFAGPVLDIAYKRKQMVELIICLVGFIFSTSNMGFLFIFLFILFNLRSNKKYLLVLVFIILLLYFCFPMVFMRFFEATSMEEGAVNSNNSRVILPFTLVWENGEFPLLGLNIAILYDLEDSLFLNTFLFVVTSFGLVGLYIFIKMLFYKKYPLVGCILIATVIIEGCYGRIDFWMALLASTIFCRMQTNRLINPIVSDVNNR